MEKVVQFRGTVYEDGSGMVAQKVMRDKTISMTAKAIYAYLCTFAWGGVDNERKAFPSISTQCKELGIKSDKTYYKHRKQLEEAGYITIEKTGRNELGEFKNNIYYIEAVVKQSHTVKNTVPQNLPYGKKYGAVKNTVLRKQKISLNNKTNTLNKTTTTEIKNHVVVREKYESLFQKKLTEKQAEDLITLADKHQVDLIKKMKNTYEMHCMEPRKSIVASIKHAIVNGDWEIASSTVSNPKPLPKAVAEQLNGKRGQQELTREQLEAKKLEIQRKIAMLEEEIAEAF